MPDTIAFIGLGLIGGSIAKAIRKFPRRYRLIAWNPHADRVDAAIEEGVIDVLHVVEIDDAQTRQRPEAEQAAQLAEEGARLVGQLRLLFHIDSVYHQCSPSVAFRARAPMSRRQKALSKWIVSARA